MFFIAEEVFSDTSAMWFSPNGDKLAYASFNDFHVNIMTIAYYGEPGAIASQYPEALYLRYPKVFVPYHEYSLIITIFHRTS